MDKHFQEIFKDGVRIITLDSWHEFQRVVSTLKSKRGYVWRGQTKDESSGWFLWSSFDRSFQIKNPDIRAKKLRKQLDNFKTRMNHAFPNVLPKDDLSIWALGQHYGLKTPLIDWTCSPYIAAYFAFVEESSPTDEYRYIYALNRSIERLLSKEKKADELISTDRSVLFIDELPFSSRRFIAQQGVFTKAFQGHDVWEYVRTFSRKRPTQEVLVKIRIPTRDRQDCLSELHSQSIDQMNLLLDFHTVVDQCNNDL